MYYPDYLIEIHPSYKLGELRVEYTGAYSNIQFFKGPDLLYENNMCPESVLDMMMIVKGNPKVYDTHYCEEVSLSYIFDALLEMDLEQWKYMIKQRLRDGYWGLLP